MDCTDAKLRMEPYATGNLASPDREEFEKHIADCEGCRLELDLMRAGVSGGGGAPPAEPPPDPPLEVMRSGDPGFAPGAAFGASSGLDEASFADVASQLSDEGAFDSIQLDQTGPPVLPSPGPQPEPPPPPTAPEPPRSAVEPSARVLPGGPDPDYSLDSLLADATPAPPETDAPPTLPLDPLANVAPPVSPPAPRPPSGLPRPERRAAPPAWDFEPAEAGRGAAPPEESLFFAEEALARARGAGERRKGGAIKLALWVAGTGVGVALLLFAAWIAWHARPSDQTERMVAQRYAAPERHTTVEPPAREATGEAPPQAPAPEPAASGGIAAPRPVEETPAAAPPAPSQPPALSASSVAPPTTLPKESRPAPPPSRPQASRATKPAPEGATAPAKPHPRPTPPPQDASVRASEPQAASTSRQRAEPTERTAETGTALRPAAPPPAGSSGERERPSPPARASGTERTAPEEPDAGSAPPRAAPQPSAPSSAPDHAAEEPAITPPGEAPASETPALTRTASPKIVPPASPTGESSSAGEAEGAPGGEPREAEPAAPPARPIDRLHLATVAAEQRGDLRTLRDMRDTWKHFLEKSGVGPDRIRAKRELADCLWAIQALTGRRSDQRDALRAYRDYLLNAPAGGADRRTVSRTKQLQDALSESN